MSNRYSSHYFDTFLQKIARRYNPDVLESMRRGMTDPSISPHEQAAYRRAYEAAIKDPANNNPTAAKQNAAPPPRASTPQPQPQTAPPPRASTPQPQPQTAPPPRASTPPPPPPPPSSPPPSQPPPPSSSGATPSAPKSFWAGVPNIKSLAGGAAIGAGINMGANALIPKFNEDTYLGQVGNELRSLAIDTGASAAGTGALTKGVGAIPGAIFGAGMNAANKIWRVGTGLNELLNPNSEHNKYLRESKEVTDRLEKTFTERRNAFNQRHQEMSRVPQVSSPNPTALNSAPNMAPVAPTIPATSSQPSPTETPNSVPQQPTAGTPTRGFGASILETIPDKEYAKTLAPMAEAADSELRSIADRLRGTQKELSEQTKTPSTEQVDVPPVDTSTAVQAPSVSAPIKPNAPMPQVPGPSMPPQVPKPSIPAPVPKSAPQPVMQPTRSANSVPVAKTTYTPRSTYNASSTPQARPSLLQQTSPTQNSNIVQNSKYRGIAGTVSNAFGRMGDSIQNASRGRLGSGDQRRETSFLPTQTSTKARRPKLPPRR